jgi:thiamine biosynthesis lipoprotein
VEIGGEVYCSGKKSAEEPWTIGITTPREDNYNNEMTAIVALENRGMATSGNYRNFYVKDGQRYAHTINPKTGYPVSHGLLSVSVLADDCMTADAWATAFMVLGTEKSKEILIDNPGLEAYFIYNDEKGKMKTFATEGFERNLKKELKADSLQYAE